MPKFKVYARRITDIETTVEAADQDDAAVIASEMDPNDRRWEDTGSSVLDDISSTKDVTAID